MLSFMARRLRWSRCRLEGSEPNSVIRLIFAPVEDSEDLVPALEGLLPAEVFIIRRDPGI